MGSQLYLGDNVTILRLAVPDASVQLTVTSPPYDNLRTYNGFTWDFEALAQELYRVTKPGGVVVWVVADATVNGSETGTSFRQALGFMAAGFKLYDTMIWKKAVASTPTQDRYYAGFEYMFIFSKRKPSALNLIADRPNVTAGTFRSVQTRSNAEDRSYKPGERHLVPAFSRRFNVWRISTDRSGGGHVAVFPEALARDHIISWSNPGDTVLDPFLGSGTTGKMAVELGRKFIGIEISEEYLKIAQTRIAIAEYEKACR